MNANLKTSTRLSVKRTIRCAVYTRVSTDDQAQGEYSSLNAQKDICEHYISIHREEDWISAAHFEDAGYSGSNMDRPGIKNLLEEVRAGNVDMIVVYKLDRISRSLRELYDFWETLQNHNVNFASATQQIDTATPHGMLFLNMLLSFAEFEREQTRERTIAKLTERAKHGKWNGGWVPLGYIYDKATQKLMPNPDEHELIEDLFNQAIRLKNPTAVAKYLNTLGRRTRKRTLVRKDGSTRTVGEKRFVGDRVLATITNPLYKGMIVHNEQEYPAEHPGLVSKSLWQAANDALSHDTGIRRIYTRDKHVHLLKGLIKCGHCGMSLTPKPAGKKDPQGNPYLYYTCTNVSKDGGAATCRVRNIPVRPFEDLIIGYIGQIGENPEIIEATVRAANETKNKSIKPLKAKLDKLDKRHAELSEGMKQCMAAAKKKGARNLADEFLQEGERMATEKRELELEREKLKIDILYKEKVVTDARIIADTLKQFVQVIRKLSDEEQKELIRLLVKEITVNHFDPEKDKDPAGVGAFKAKIRTRWYAVNISLYANDLFSGISENSVKSSHLDKIGSAGDADIRTIWHIPMVVGIPLLRWSAGPFITKPFIYPEHRYEITLKTTLHQECKTSSAKHPIHLAVKWQKTLNADSSINQAILAKNEGISRARITQIMRLLSLPEEIQDTLLRLQEPEELRLFSERRMRAIALLGDHERQVNEFRRLAQ